MLQASPQAHSCCSPGHAGWWVQSAISARNRSWCTGHPQPCFLRCSAFHPARPARRNGPQSYKLAHISIDGADNVVRVLTIKRAVHILQHGFLDAVLNHIRYAKQSMGSRTYQALRSWGSISPSATGAGIFISSARTSVRPYNFRLLSLPPAGRTVDKCFLISLHRVDRGSFRPVRSLTSHNGTLLRWRHRLGYFRHWFVFRFLRWADNSIRTTAWQQENSKSRWIKLEHFKPFLWDKISQK